MIKSIKYPNFHMYEFLIVYTHCPEKLKDCIINQIMKLTNDILVYSKQIIIDNKSGIINNIKQIPEKENISSL